MNVVFAGTPEFAARHLEALINSHHTVSAVITQPDRPGKRGRKLVPSPVKIVARAAGLPVIQPERLKADALVPFKPDVLVVVAFGQILKAPVLELPELGCVNVHASLLPRWRGAAPVQRALLSGDTGFGVTLIQMDKGLDTGDILASSAIRISPDETAASLFRKLEAVGPGLLISTLDDLAKGTAVRTPQPAEGVTYAHKIDKGEAEIDWQAPAEVIERQVRAFNPDPVAFTFLADKRVRVHQGAIPGTPGRGKPGEVLAVTRSGVEVACGEGSYQVTRLQVPVGKGAVLSPADILNGWKDLIYPGAQFMNGSS